MSFFWVYFEDRNAGTIEAEGNTYGTAAEREAVLEDAKTRAAKFGRVKGIHRLPYPAEPRLDVRSDCPSFCMYPDSCKGSGSCPRNYSCTE